MSAIVVAGALASKYRNGGEAWVRLSWIRAFRQLGFDVWFVEQIAPEILVDDRGRPCPLDRSVNLDYFAGVTGAFGLEGRTGLFTGSGQWWGVEPGVLEEVAGESALLLNISGNLVHRPLLERFRRRVYLDIDPGFTQHWHVRGLLGDALAGHDLHLTIGRNIGAPGCPIPQGGVRWHPTRQPVVLADWPESPSDGCDRLTTVGSLRGTFGRVEHPGGLYGLKIHEMRKVADLPRRVAPQMELAFAIGPGDGADHRLLAGSGWRLVDPEAVAGGPGGFRDYVTGSDGEFSVAQGIYVETASGWFSDRTVRYLAAGKPAIVQDTGLDRHLPVGEGLLTFRDRSEAAGAVNEVCRDYRRHARAARRIAEECFEAGRVAGEVAELAGVAP